MATRITFTIENRYQHDSGRRPTAAEAWKSAYHYARKDFFPSAPGEPVTLTVNGVSISGTKARLSHLVDQQIRAAKN